MNKQTKQECSMQYTKRTWSRAVIWDKLVNLYVPFIHSLGRKRERSKYSFHLKLIRSHFVALTCAICYYQVHEMKFQRNINYKLRELILKYNSKYVRNKWEKREIAASFYSVHLRYDVYLTVARCFFFISSETRICTRSWHSCFLTLKLSIITLVTKKTKAQSIWNFKHFQQWR